VRADIEKYLGTVTETTAKKISNAIGVPQFEVAKELNHMHGDGAVEREKRPGGGNEYVYWLTRSEANSAEKVVTVVESISATRPVSSVDAGKGVPVAPAKPDVTADEPPHLRDLLTLLGVSEDSQFKLVDAIDGARALIHERDDLREMHKATAENFVIYRDAAVAEVESLKAANAKLRENTAALERSIDDLTGVADVELPKIYVTVGKYVKPKRHADLLRAQRRAATLVRTEKESEVLVCAPVGRMVRGSEWKSQ
jgi:hypothetical protein